MCFESLLFSGKTDLAAKLLGLKGNDTGNEADDPKVKQDMDNMDVDKKEIKKRRRRRRKTSVHLHLHHLNLKQ